MIFQIKQGGLIPALDRDAADVIKGSDSSEHIVNSYAEKHSLTSRAIVDLIKMSLKIQSSMQTRLTVQLDTSMLQRLQAAIDSGDLHTDRQTNSFIERLNRLGGRHLMEMG
jgi:hypothetical protein